MLVEQAALALLGYIEESADGFRILVRDSPVAQASGSFSSLISDVATQVEHLLADEFKRRRLDPKNAPMYAQMLVGMVALTGQWWLDARKPKRAEVAAHLVNLAWNGLSGLEAKPTLQQHPLAGAVRPAAARSGCRRGPGCGSAAGRGSARPTGPAARPRRPARPARRRPRPRCRGAP